MEVFDYTKGIMTPYTGDLIRGVVYVSEDYMEFGWFPRSPDNILVYNSSEGLGRYWVYGISKEALPNLIFSKKIGVYVLPSRFDRDSVLNHKYIYGSGEFPYDIARNYEATDSMNSFVGVQKVLNTENYELSKHFKYTFGIEFETSGGFVPRELCYRDGLIPLRDGSIRGIEYSTVVLQGNEGINLLRQQMRTLKEYTIFNKECALHIHLGGYPVTEKHIYVLSYLWSYIEYRLVDANIVPAYTFETSRYKSNKKDYCKYSNTYDSFSELYQGLTGSPYLGSLVYPHKADVEKKAKWNIAGRYYGLNLINMICYKGPKTVEFRFLRPSYNFRKLYLWLCLLNAVLLYAERVADEYDERECPISKYLVKRARSIRRIIYEVYPVDFADFIMEDLNLLQIAVVNQTANGDLYGRDTFIEDTILKDDL